ncbi:hypothetical protein Dda3937_04513 [Dickeya dadantii 3937]|uniref:Uncharacterized protein n=1 Tax=Dickeya dadantii (strain 3937) TaxID=198628 RepID=E0SGQ6_DICD3|nr:hypothetical protein Dda3937_04513 [Dickeya dadantii 3937]
MLSGSVVRVWRTAARKTYSRRRAGNTAQHRLILPLEHLPGRGIKMMQARRDRVLRPVAMLNEQAVVNTHCC